MPFLRFYGSQARPEKLLWIGVGVITYQDILLVGAGVLLLWVGSKLPQWFRHIGGGSGDGSGPTGVAPVGPDWKSDEADATEEESRPRV